LHFRFYLPPDPTGFSQTFSNGDLTMQILGSKELNEQVHDASLCVSCGACVGICPYFKAHKGQIAMTFSCDLTQGSCYAYCPRTEVDFEQLSQILFNESYNGAPIGLYRQITASKAGQATGKGAFQNGGTVSSLISFALKKGVIDSAALTDNKGLLPTPRLVTKPEEVLECSSTKYMATPTLSLVNEARKNGQEKMGVVGTSCQMTALAQMKTNPLQKEDFKDPVSLSIGLFCTWALDTRKFLALLAEKIETEKIIGMDVPPPPAEIFVVKTEDGTVEIPLDEIRAIVPEGCSLCPDMTAEWADISVGAFEGKSDWNTMIIRTEKGEKLVAEAVKEGYLVLDDFPSESLEHLTLGAGNKKKRAEQNASKEAK